MNQRMKTGQRQEQIVAAAQGLIVERGLAGATIGRIAGQVGLTEGAIYRHFKNRHEILLAVLEATLARLIGQVVSPEPDILRRIEVQSESLYGAVMSHPEDAKVLFEFICAPPGENLREVVQASLLGVITYAEEVLGEGVRQGSLRKDLNTKVASWEIFSLGFTLYFASLLGLAKVLTEETALEAVGNILANIKLDP